MCCWTLGERDQKSIRRRFGKEWSRLSSRELTLLPSFPRLHQPQRNRVLKPSIWILLQLLFLLIPSSRCVLPCSVLVLEEGRREWRARAHLSFPSFLFLLLLQLPTETIRDIFDHVKDQKDRIRLAQTCKRFKKVRRSVQIKIESRARSRSLVPPVLFARS